MSAFDPNTQDGAAELGKIAVAYWVRRGAIGVGFEVYRLIAATGIPPQEPELDLSADRHGAARRAADVARGKEGCMIRYPYDTRPVPLDIQAWIITLGRRGRSVNRIAATVGVAWKTVRGHLDGWGVRRKRRRRA